MQEKLSPELGTFAVSGQYKFKRQNCVALQINTALNYLKAVEIALRNVFVQRETDC